MTIFNNKNKFYFNLGNNYFLWFITKSEDADFTKLKYLFEVESFSCQLLSVNET